MPFLAFFTVFALLDFVLLFTVGSHIGLLTTLALVLGTGFLGLHLIRREGVATFARAQERMARGELPSGELLTGAALIFGGALLMAPGFLSDALGFMCLIPDARRLLGKLLGRLGMRFQGVHVQAGAYQARPGHDADWQQAGEAHGSRQRPSSQDDAGEPLEGDFIAHDERRG
ncbi:FxsA family protein [Halomonas getboli]|uniref:FxsA family protein n=1 Tax=Halomonas getboli TaxID=2935862 RepID=UPI001FFF9CC3|nr:FxsA family protein [Halomonas getboli]MCK2182852.1 FxsA family protein [Halomonas getboli]